MRRFALHAQPTIWVLVASLGAVSLWHLAGWRASVVGSQVDPAVCGALATGLLAVAGLAGGVLGIAVAGPRLGSGGRFLAALIAASALMVISLLPQHRAAATAAESAFLSAREPCLHRIIEPLDLVLRAMGRNLVIDDSPGGESISNISSQMDLSEDLARELDRSIDAMSGYSSEMLGSVDKEHSPKLEFPTLSLRGSAVFLNDDRTVVQIWNPDISGLPEAQARATRRYEESLLELARTRRTLLDHAARVLKGGMPQLGKKLAGFASELSRLRFEAAVHPLVSFSNQHGEHLLEVMGGAAADAPERERLEILLWAALDHYRQDIRRSTLHRWREGLTANEPQLSGIATIFRKGRAVAGNTLKAEIEEAIRASARSHPTGEGGDRFLQLALRELAALTPGKRGEFIERLADEASVNEGDRDESIWTLQGDKALWGLAPAGFAVLHSVVVDPYFVRLIDQWECNSLACGALAELLQEWGEKANASEPEIARALEMLASAQLLPLGTGKEVVGSALYELACAKAWELLGIDRLADQQHGAGTLKEAVFAAFASWPNKDTARMEKFGPLGLARELASGPGITVVKDYFYAVKALAAQRPAHWNEAGWRFPYQLGAENYLVSERLQDLWSKANKDLGFKEPPEKSHYETHFLPFYSDNGLIDQFVGAIARAASDQNSDQGHPEVAERCAAYWILTMENFGLGEGKPLLNPFEREIYEPRRIPKPGDKITVAELLEGIEDATLRTVVIDWLRGLQPRNRDDTGYEHLFPRSGDDLERR